MAAAAARWASWTVQPSIATQRRAPSWGGGGLLPLRRVPPRLDGGDAPFPDLVPTYALEETERLHRRRQGQQGP